MLLKLLAKHLLCEVTNKLFVKMLIVVTKCNEVFFKGCKLLDSFRRIIETEVNLKNLIFFMICVKLILELEFYW